MPLNIQQYQQELLDKEDSMLKHQTYEQVIWLEQLLEQRIEPAVWPLLESSKLACWTHCKVV
jgi:hypothetical protein